MLRSIAINFLSAVNTEATARTTGVAGMVNAFFGDGEQFRQTQAVATISRLILSTIKN